MNREIIFRGLRVDGKGWAYGDLIHGVGLKKGKLYILPENIHQPGCHHLDGFEVIPETIGQFTGLKDKNEVEIYEGDKFKGEEHAEYYLIEWNNEECMFQANLYGYNVSYGEGSQEIYDNEITCIDTNCFELSALTEDEIIGNIHENPELLKGDNHEQ